MHTFGLRNPLNMWNLKKAISMDNRNRLINTEKRLRGGGWRLGEKGEGIEKYR